MKLLKESIMRIKNSIFWSSVAVLVSGNILAQLIGLFTTPIVSRLYDPEAFGEYFIILSTATIIGNLVTLGLNSAIMAASDDDECDDVFLVSFITSVILSTLILILMIIISPILKIFDSGMEYIYACLLVYAFVILNNLHGLFTIYVNRKRIDKLLFFNSIIGALVTLLITIPLGFLKWGSTGFLIAAIITSIVSIIQMMYKTNPFKRLPSILIFKRVFIKYKDYIFFQYPSNFIGGFVIQLPIQMLSANFGNANLGSYSMNEKVLGLPSRFIGTPINTIYFRTATEYYNEGKDLAGFTFSLISKLMLLALFPIITIILWGEPMFSWVLGSEWGEAGKLASFLIVQYVFMLCQNCTSYCRVAIGKQKTNLLISILRLGVVGFSIFIGIHIFGGLLNTIICLTVGTTIYLIIDMAINFYCMKRFWIKYSVFAFGYFAFICLLWITVYY